ncbi:hypothetical protein BT69DRAFT_148065 [Atractiella rhizophila]|nr:hypothetical protein BT69DRAFT_148065 [Atractiella rhizophila]
MSDQHYPEPPPSYASSVSRVVNPPGTAAYIRPCDSEVDSDFDCEFKLVPTTSASSLSPQTSISDRETNKKIGWLPRLFVINPGKGRPGMSRLLCTNYDLTDSPERREQMPPKPSQKKRHPQMQFNAHPSHLHLL